ncbi:MAG TPA: MrtP family glutamic-type intramembrane protease [Myxococcota bacterium]|nr:MrtP family glutamic-type intramembrane protease [Myxococcota bacterium]
MTVLPPPKAWWREPRHEIKVALLAVFGATFILALIQLIFPFTSGFMQVGLALVLLEVPIRILRLRQSNAEREGLLLEIGPIRDSLRLGLLTSLIVFPLFIGGFHLAYTELLGQPARWDSDRLARWSESIEYAPPEHCRPPEVNVWTQESQLWVAAYPGSRLTVRLDTPAAKTPLTTARLIRCQSGRALSASPITANPDGTFSPPIGQGLLFDLGDRWDFRLTVLENGAPLPEARLRIGHQRASPDEDGLVEQSRDHWWLLAYLLIHLGLVAYPEEYFFRGYLLPRLDQRLGTRRRLLGVSVGLGLVLSSLAFALLHPILIPGPHRLLVFFPALLFGWLALRQRALGAAILVHALSNVCLAIVSRMYG